MLETSPTLNTPEPISPPPVAPKSSKPPTTLIFALLILAVVAASFLLGKNFTGPKSSSTPSVGPTPPMACGTCPQFMPPSPDSCQDGTIVPGRLNECGCQMPPTCDKTTAKWEIYSDPKIMKASFKYPSDWIPGSVQAYGSHSDVEFSYQKTNLFTVSIYFNYNNGTGKPYDSLDEFLGDQKTMGKETTIDGHPAKRISDPGLPGHVIPFEKVVVFSPDNSSIISLYFSPSYYNIPNPETVFDQILSTFKFLDQASTNTIADWKTYTNKTYGFEIKYPSYLTAKENKDAEKINSVDFINASDSNTAELRIEKNFIGGWMGKMIKEEEVIVGGEKGKIQLWLNCDSIIVEDWDKCNQGLSLNKYDSAILRANFKHGTDEWFITGKTWRKGEKDEQEELNNLKQILSTFKFLD